ncbi:MAG: hypothetical protein AAF514_10950, partial [Verrucomicrobiota bacterium]
GDLAGFSIDPALFQVFPEDLRSQLESYSAQVLDFLQNGQDEALETFLAEKREEMAEVFDKLGVAKGAESLPLSRLGVTNDADEPGGDPDFAQAPAEAENTPRTVDLLLKFPDEYENYEKYLDSLKLDQWEKDYLKGSHDIALQLKASLADARDDQVKVKELLADYTGSLEQLNNRYADQMREKYDEALRAADAGGGRPDDGN